MFQLQTNYVNVFHQDVQVLMQVTVIVQYLKCQDLSYSVVFYLSGINNAFMGCSVPRDNVTSPCTLLHVCPMHILAR